MLFLKRADKLPEPGYHNTIPAGEGWYRFSFGRWRMLPEGVKEVKGDRYISETDLLWFAAKALAVYLKGKIK